jgi:hypothetical protein
VPFARRFVDYRKMDAREELGFVKYDAFEFH